MEKTADIGELIRIFSETSGIEMGQERAENMRPALDDMIVRGGRIDEKMRKPEYAGYIPGNIYLH